VEEVELADFGGRVAAATDWESIPSGTKSQMSDALGTYTSDPKVRLAMCKSLGSGLLGFSGKKEKRSNIAPVGQVVEMTQKESQDRYYTPASPKPDMDAMYWSTFVTDNLKSIDTIVSHLDYTVSETTRLLYHRWPRWLFVDWVTGRLKMPVAKWWGMAGDTFAVARERMREWGVVPKGRVNSKGVRGWWLTLELMSAAVCSADARLFGA
jgi:hypothetical protein